MQLLCTNKGHLFTLHLPCSIYSKKERGGSFNCQIMNKNLMRLYSLYILFLCSLFIVWKMQILVVVYHQWLELLSIWDVGLWDFLSCCPDQWLLFVIYFIHKYDFFMLIKIFDYIINQSFISFKFLAFIFKTNKEYNYAFPFR